MVIEWHIGRSKADSGIFRQLRPAEAIPFRSQTIPMSIGIRSGPRTVTICIFPAIAVAV